MTCPLAIAGQHADRFSLREQSFDDERAEPAGSAGDENHGRPPPGLVRALYAKGLAGRGPVPAPVRSDAIIANAKDPHAIVRAWGTLAAEVSPRVSPLLLLVRAAAQTEPALVDILEQDSAQRLARMRHNAQRLADRGFLRAGVSANQAADLMWALTAPELYELLVVRRRWTPAQLGDHIATTLAAALL